MRNFKARKRVTQSAIAGSVCGETLAFESCRFKQGVHRNWLVTGCEELQPEDLETAIREAARRGVWQNVVSSKFGRTGMSLSPETRKLLNEVLASRQFNADHEALAEAIRLSCGQRSFLSGSGVASSARTLNRRYRRYRRQLYRR